MGYNSRNQRGAAAIFIVVFFAILISVIALSFLRITVQDQQQSTNNDLSQSAYDSAGGGLEDAKRALSWYNAHCPLNIAPAPADQADCEVYNLAFTTPNNPCNLEDIIRGAGTTLPYTSVSPGSSEVKVQTGATDDKLDQAYTCVTVTTQTRDYKADAENGKSETLIPLRTVDNLPIDTIELNWFYNKSKTNPLTPNYPNSATKLLPVSGSVWEVTTPPIMRFQLIPVLRGGIDINNVNIDTRTSFLYPSTTGSGTVGLSAADSGRAFSPAITATEKTTAPNLAKCKALVDPDTFACTARINALPTATGGTEANTDYYLRIMPIYNNTDFQVKLFGNGGTDLRLFDNVAPQIDTTGRANNVFRRVQSRVISTNNSNPLRDGGFDISQGICKDFNVPVYDTDCPDGLVKP